VVGNHTKAGLTIQPVRKVKQLLLSAPSSRVCRLTVKKFPADAFHNTEFDDRDAKYNIDCERQQRADNRNWMARMFLFCFSSSAAPRDQVGDFTV
jgi:hypothetical protein